MSLTDATVAIAPDAWTQTGEYLRGVISDRLLATVTINGYDMHLEAYAIDEDEMGRTGIVRLLDETADHGLSLLEPDSCPTTIELAPAGVPAPRTYVLIAIPFAD